MNNLITGECGCGSVTFEANEKPLVELLCHCNNCQQATGKAFVGIAFFKMTAVTVDGELASQRYIADTGKNTSREFCSRCKQAMFDKSDGFPTLLGVMAEPINTPFKFAPSCHVWVESKQADVDLQPGLIVYEKGLS